jgi:hypothetical protein
VRSVAIVDTDGFLDMSDADFDAAGKNREDLLLEAEENRARVSD